MQDPNIQVMSDIVLSIETYSFDDQCWTLLILRNVIILHIHQLKAKNVEKLADFTIFTPKDNTLF